MSYISACRLILFHAGARQLKDHDYLSLQFLGARDAWLGCTDSVCDLRTCPSRGDNYRNFDTICSGERFQIIGKGTNASPITSGQKIRLRSLRESNTYMGCSFNNRCDKRTCPGTTSEAKNFNRCSGEIFEIYAHNRNIGDTIYNGDVVMLYFPRTGRYVSIQGQDDKDDTSLNFCPGLAPPAYLSYGICSKNTFRIYRKP